MAFFGGKDDTRRLEAQIQQKDCQLMNFESCLQRTKAELEQVKRDRDQLKLNVRAVHEKCTALEATSEKHSKDAKQKNEMCVSLHNQLTRWKREKDEIDRQVKEGAVKFGAQSVKLEAAESKIKELQEERDRLRHWCQSTEKKLSSIKEDHSAEIQRLVGLLESKDKAAEKAARDQRDQYPGGMSPNTVSQKLSQSNQIMDKLREAKDNLSEREKENFDLKKRMAQLSEVNAKAFRLENEVLTLQKQVRGFEGQGAEMSKLRRVLVRLEGRNSDLEGEVQGVRKELEKYASVEAENKQMKEQCQVVEGIQFELNSTRSELEGKKNEASDLQKQMSALSEERQELAQQVKVLRESMARAKEAIQSKENMLDVQRELTVEQQRQCDTIHKNLRDAQAEISRLVKENKDLVARDKRSASVMKALEERIEKMKTEMRDLQDKVANMSKDAQENQSECVRLDIDLQMRTSELFDSKSEVARLKSMLAETETKNSTPNLGTSQVEIFEMESKFREERRLLESELAMEKKSHDETRGLLKDEQARFEKELKDAVAAATAAAVKEASPARVQTSAASGSISLAVPGYGAHSAPTTRRRIPPTVDLEDIMPTPSGRTDLPPSPMSGVGSPMSEGPHQSPFFEDQADVGQLSFSTGLQDSGAADIPKGSTDTLSFQPGEPAGQETPPFSGMRVGSASAGGQQHPCMESQETNRTVSFIPVHRAPAEGDDDGASKSTIEGSLSFQQAAVPEPPHQGSPFSKGSDPLLHQHSEVQPGTPQSNRVSKATNFSVLSPTNSSVFHSPGVPSPAANSSQGHTESRRPSLLGRQSIERERAPSPLSEDEEYLSAEGTVSPNAGTIENCESFSNGADLGRGAKTEDRGRISSPFSERKTRHSQ